MPSLRRQWDWLRDLLARGRARASQQYALTTGGRVGSRVDALRDALGQLGLRDAALIDGVADALQLRVEEFRAPVPATLMKVVAEDLAQLLPLLVEHRSAGIAAIGRTWLQLPEIIYAIASDQCERWLCDSAAVGALLHARVRREGLAWLGPDALRRLVDRGAHAEVRGAARQWCDRLDMELAS